MSHQACKGNFVTQKLSGSFAVQTSVPIFLQITMHKEVQTVHSGHISLGCALLLHCLCLRLTADCHMHACTQARQGQGNVANCSTALLHGVSTWLVVACDRRRKLSANLSDAGSTHRR